jgi:rhodanese-related sulfurtransferase
MGAPLLGTMLIVDGGDSRFRTLRLRARDAACALCGDAPSIRSLADALAWSARERVVAREGGGGEVAACDCEPLAEGAAGDAGEGTAPAATGAGGRGIPDMAVEALAEAFAAAAASELPPPFVLDVRIPLQADLLALAGSHHLPYDRLLSKERGRALEELEAALLRPRGGESGAQARAARRIHVLCRRGVDSRLATLELRAAGFDAVNVEGGLAAWAARVDPRVPK